MRRSLTERMIRYSLSFRRRIKSKKRIKMSQNLRHLKKMVSKKR